MIYYSKDCGEVWIGSSKGGVWNVARGFRCKCRRCKSPPSTLIKGPGAAWESRDDPLRLIMLHSHKRRKNVTRGEGKTIKEGKGRREVAVKTDREKEMQQKTTRFK